MWNTQHLFNLPVYVGMFNPDHLDYEIHRLERDEPREPSLVEMVETTIKILQRSDKGFFLLVEGKTEIDKLEYRYIAYINNILRSIHTLLNLIG